MPFTISHIAAVLPLQKIAGRELPLAALAIGSMSPDFAYFLPVDLGRLSHTLVGIFVFCLPIGIALFGLFESILKYPTVALMPQWVVAKLGYRKFSWRLNEIALAVVAVAMGALTHIAWDSFTHAYSPVVKAWPLLQSIVFDVHRAPIRLYKFLQHISTVLGLMILCIWILRRPRREQSEIPAIQPSWSAYRLPAYLTAIGMSCAVGASYALLHMPDSFERMLFWFAIGAMLGFAITWSLICFALARTVSRRAT